ncbi:hypothetical protein F5H01DRAFT_166930 [Linnemannia elongata]|nr:hypothetical protein F5H01DRAFT_166930 [Linnemannia elongata]
MLAIDFSSYTPYPFASFLHLPSSSLCLSLSTHIHAHTHIPTALRIDRKHLLFPSPSLDLLFLILTLFLGFLLTLSSFPLCTIHADFSSCQQRSLRLLVCTRLSARVDVAHAQRHSTNKLIHFPSFSPSSLSLTRTNPTSLASLATRTRLEVH